MPSVVSSMKETLQDALDDLTSTRSSFGRRNRALAVLEQQLALACVQSSDDDTLDTYLNLQDAFECNVPSRILAWIQCTMPQLESCTNKSSTSKERDAELNTLCSQLCQGLSIIQGVSLHHQASKSFLGRRFSLEILTELLLTSRHTPIVDSSEANRSKLPEKSASVIHLTSAVLDTLLCVLVDSPPALRAFEEVNGVQAVVKILKRAGTPREVRMKCLEFLYFYLMDESPTPTQPDEIHSLLTSPVTTRPNTPSRSPETKIFARSVPGTLNISFASSSTFSSSGSATSSSSSSSTSSFSSSTTNTSVENISSPIKKSYSISTFTSPDTRTPSSPPPSGARRFPAPLQSRSMLMLRKEVDYEPLSPKKPRGFRPGLGVTDATGPATPSASRVRETSKRTISSDRAEGAEARSSKHNRVRTTDEKKEILGSMLGNVDALVEGVRKAGIWGLG
ncbi:CDC14-domain-containing protein [Rhizopogon vinicolor AM-OR11-026]|uniref:CDC14-domain-containing protein n=1 Tax=Rhizopogon vinicolor AM-OR11-026 TaxID=1314800 RepID=A0A1B7N167_9AGAM|nr:CDC14-domain-containing protein [Rhizopogon vinicolor AM-OR11-026]